MRLAIIIPIHNGLSYTRGCLKTLHEQIKVSGSEKVDIIIVDDGSTDGSAEWIKQHYPGVVIVQGDGSLWWSGSMNLGVQHAVNNLESDYILWWNNDVIPAPDYFTNLLKIISVNDSRQIVGSKVCRAENPNMIWSMGGTFNPKNGWKDMIGFNKPDGPEFDVPGEADGRPGIGSCFPASVFRETGFLDARVFPQYHGDTDFTWRAKLKGYKIMVFPELKLFNHTENTSKKHDGNIGSLWSSLTTIKSNYNIRKDFIFYRKYAESPLAYRVLFIKYGKYIGGFLKWRLFGLFGIKKTSFQA